MDLAASYTEVCDQASIFLTLCPHFQELVEKSLADEGNIAYDYFVSGTRDGVMMICETWQNAKVLKTHMESAHFTTLVPQIEALTKHGLKLEQFQFEK